MEGGDFFQASVPPLCSVLRGEPLCSRHILSLTWISVMGTTSSSMQNKPKFVFLASGCTQVTEAEADHPWSYFTGLSSGLCLALHTFQLLVKRIVVEWGFLPLHCILIWRLSSLFEQHLQKLKTTLQHQQNNEWTCNVTNCCVTCQKYFINLSQYTIITGRCV